MREMEVGLIALALGVAETGLFEGGGLNVDGVEMCVWGEQMGEGEGVGAASGCGVDGDEGVGAGNGGLPDGGGESAGVREEVEGEGCGRGVMEGSADVSGSGSDTGGAGRAGRAGEAWDNGREGEESCVAHNWESVRGGEGA